MKVFQKIIVFLLLITMFLYPVSTYGANRVVCKVEVLSEQSAYVQLKWLDSTNKTPIRIVSWTVEDGDTLKITYMTGKDVITGWDSKKIEGNQYHFPMKVTLVEQNAEPISFKDMPKNVEVKESLLNLYHRGIISGYSDGSFKPDSFVTRAEFAKMIVEAGNFTLSASSTAKFDDVPKTHWAFGYIMNLTEKGILTGRNGKIFDPAGNVSLGEAVAILNRTFSVVDEKVSYTGTLTDHWSNNDFIALAESGIVKATDSFYNPYTPNQKATRGQCAVLISRILESIYDLKTQ